MLLRFLACMRCGWLSASLFLAEAREAIMAVFNVDEFD
jgi:hypothetical protein